MRDHSFIRDGSRGPRCITEVSFSYYLGPGVSGSGLGHSLWRTSAPGPSPGRASLSGAHDCPGRRLTEGPPLPKSRSRRGVPFRPQPTAAGRRVASCLLLVIALLVPLCIAWSNHTIRLDARQLFFAEVSVRRMPVLSVCLCVSASVHETGEGEGESKSRR